MQESINNVERFEFDYEQNVFRKHLNKEKFHSELEMSQLAASLSLKSDLFNTPAIKNVEFDNHIIEFELRKEAITLRQFFIKKAKFGASTNQLAILKKVFYRVGQSISIFHNVDKESTNISKRRFPKDFFSPPFNNNNVFIHGDFTLRNILYSVDTNRLDIIDWNTSPIFDFSANYGPRYWDLSFFISSLFYFSYSTFLSFDVRKQLSKSFLSGYLNISNVDTQNFLVELSEFLYHYNYYKLYNSATSVKKNKSDLLLLSRTKSKLDKFIKLLPSLIIK